MFKKTTTVLMMLALGACADSSDLGRGKTGKTITVTGYSYDQVWDASLKAIQNVRGTQSLEVSKSLTITKKDKTNGVIQANSGVSLLSWGEVVGVFVSPTTKAPAYTVEVESLTQLKTNVTSNNWEDEILAGIKQKLPAKH
jgi:hypothetical protein